MFFIFLFVQRNLIMKKLLQLIAISSFAFSFSQSFGVKGGLNLTTINNEGWDDTNVKVGYYAGLYMHAPVNEVFSIQPELIYNSVGAKYNNGSNAHTLTLNYIAVPIMFQFELIPQFYVEAGPQMGFLVSNKDKYESGSKTTTVTDSDRFNSFDLSLGLGAGIKIKNGLKLTARYLAGFTDINKNGETSLESNDEKLRNSGFQIGLQYGF